MRLVERNDAMQSWSGSMPADANPWTVGFKADAVRRAHRSRVPVVMERGACTVTAAFSTVDLDIEMTRRMLRQGQARALVIGPERATGAVIRALRADFGSPVLTVRRDGALTLPAPAGTLLIHDVATLNLAEQDRVLQWLDVRPLGTSVVAVTSEPLFPLVQRGSFLPALFYRLNLIVIDVTGADAFGMS
jgi:hypothetical protein